MLEVFRRGIATWAQMQQNAPALDDGDEAQFTALGNSAAFSGTNNRRGIIVKDCRLIKLIWNVEANTRGVITSFISVLNTVNTLQRIDVGAGLVGIFLSLIIVEALEGDIYQITLEMNPVDAGSITPRGWGVEFAA